MMRSSAFPRPAPALFSLGEGKARSGWWELASHDDKGVVNGIRRLIHEIRKPSVFVKSGERRRRRKKQGSCQLKANCVLAVCVLDAAVLE
jgi:hypothetical protein